MATRSEPIDRVATAERARTHLQERLDDLLGERLRQTAKRPRDGAGWVDVSAHDLDARCPARWSVKVDDFVMSAPTVAGAVGRLALRGRGPTESVGAAVTRVLAGLGDADRDGAWFADWYCGELDRSGRAAVATAATTWATGALAAVGGRELSWVTRRTAYDVPGRTVRLKANWDASDHAARPEVLVVMSRRAPSDPMLALVAGFDALVDGVLRRQVPDRVRIGSAATGSTTRFPVTWDLVEAAVDRVVELVAWRVAPDAAPTNPGRWCADCHLSEICPDAPVEVRHT